MSTKLTLVFKPILTRKCCTYLERRPRIGHGIGHESIHRKFGVTTAHRSFEVLQRIGQLCQPFGRYVTHGVQAVQKQNVDKRATRSRFRLFSSFDQVCACIKIIIITLSLLKQYVFFIFELIFTLNLFQPNATEYVTKTTTKTHGRCFKPIGIHHCGAQSTYF